MATAASTESTDGPVLNLINKRLRALRKKLNRILQMEEAISQGKPINKEQEEVLRSKPSVLASIDELEKLRQPLSSAVAEEIQLAVQRHNQPEHQQQSDGVVEDLLNLLYFGSLFDVKPQSEFTATMLTRTHERGCCLTYDYVTDDATDLLGERDLDLISTLGGLLISRPVDSSLSHKNSLQRCIEHAKLWLANSEQPIEPSASVSYAGLREKLNKIMASDYFTTTPEMKAPVEVAAAAAAGNYAPFQVQVSVPSVPAHGIPVEEDSITQCEEKDEEGSDFQVNDTGDNQSIPAEELQKDEPEDDGVGEVIRSEEAKQPGDTEQIQREGDLKEQPYAYRRNYQNQRGGRGGRRVYSNGRGGRGGPRGGGGYQQNGRNHYYDQPGNYYPRNYYSNRGKGGRGGGHPYNNHSSGGHTPADVGVAS
ncbi:hypothetical protein K2173_006424 [Erythroxylum novogranatense]|uniref:Glycine-rich protein n=1 Tax=Erythroxylum novogranatense TaxID=1862640 RepID=A0AAV8U6N8_9ROSI|nr:hypothetical protein K2173_006424 [Erythroxylum novogranatense]